MIAKASSLESIRPPSEYKECGRGEANSTSAKCAPSEDHGLYAADDALEENEDLFDNEGPEHLGEGEVLEIPNDSDEEDCAPRRVAPEPGEPTAEEVAEHRIDHTPYRSWCEHCVRGRGYGEQHRRGPESTIPVVSADYLLVTKRGVHLKNEQVEASEVVMKILVIKDSKSKYIGAHLVPVKGLGCDRYAAEKMRRDILWLGYSRVILRSDNEPAIVAVLKETLKGLRIDVLEQAAEDHPPAHDSKSSGSVENAVRQVQGLLRTVKDCLETQIQQRIPCEHPLMAWMVHHVGWVLTTRVRSQDGKTGYERLRGKPFSKRMVGFGETCLAKLTKRAVAQEGVPKLAPRWTKAVFLGYHRETHEYSFHTQGRLLRTRALQRVPTGSRWNAEALQEVKVTPYSLYQKPDTEAILARDPSIAVEQRMQTGDKEKRDVYLRQSDFQQHGYTAEGCPRCDVAIRYGWDTPCTASHSYECRRRMREAIRDSGPAGKRRVEDAMRRKGEGGAEAREEP